MNRVEVECVRVSPIHEFEATAFDLTLGRINYRVVIGWVDLDNLRYPDIAVQVQLAVAEERMYYAHLASKAAAGRCDT